MKTMTYLAFHARSSRLHFEGNLPLNKTHPFRKRDYAPMMSTVFEFRRQLYRLTLNYKANLLISFFR